MISPSNPIIRLHTVLYGSVGDVAMTRSPRWISNLGMRDRRSGVEDEEEEEDDGSDE